MAEVTPIAGMLRELRVPLSRKRARQPGLDDAGGGAVTHVYDLLARSATAALVTLHLASHELPAVIVAAHLGDTPRYQHRGEIGFS